MHGLLKGLVAAGLFAAAAGTASAQGVASVGYAPTEYGPVVMEGGGCGAGGCGPKGCGPFGGCCAGGEWFPGFKGEHAKQPKSYQPQTPYDVYQRRQGLHPAIKKLFGCQTRLPNPPKIVPSTGTLVFPNHPFARSPRDYFMEE
jgi:hypothetical protein